MNSIHENTAVVKKRAITILLQVKTVNLVQQRFTVATIVVILSGLFCFIYEPRLRYSVLFFYIAPLVFFAFIYKYFYQTISEKGIQIGLGFYPRVIPWEYLARIKYSRIPNTLILRFYPKKSSINTESSSGILSRFYARMQHLLSLRDIPLESNSVQFEDMLSALKIIIAHNNLEDEIEASRGTCDLDDNPFSWGKCSYLHKYFLHGILSLCLVVSIGSIAFVEIYSLNQEDKIGRLKQNILKAGFPVDTEGMEKLIASKNSVDILRSSDNAAPLYVGMASALVGTDTPEYNSILKITYENKYKLTESQLSLLRNLFKKNEIIFPILDEAAKRPNSLYFMKYSPPHKVYFPHLRELRDLARYLHLYSIQNNDGIKYIFDLAHSLRNEFALISFLVHRAIVELGLHAISQQLATVTLTQSGLNEFQRLIDRELGCLTLATPIAGEFLGALLIDGLNYIDSPDGRVKPHDSPWLEDKNIGNNKFLLSTLSHYKSLLHIIPKNVNGNYPRAEIENYNLWYATDCDGVQGLYDSKTLSGFFKKYYQLIAQLRAAQGAIAVERFKLRTGRLPSSVSELENSLQFTFPEDPFTENKLIYSKRDTGYIIYSLGLNGTDQNGQNDKTAEIDDQAFEVMSPVQGPSRIDHNDAADMDRDAQK